MGLRWEATASEELVLSSPPTLDSFSILGWGRLQVDRNAKSVIACGIVYSPFAYVDIGLGTDGTTLGIHAETNFTSLLSLTVGDVFFWCLTCAGAGTNTLTGYAAKAGDSALTTAQRNVAVAGTTASRFTIGGTEYNEQYNGMLDSVMVFDSVLTQAEVEAQWLMRRPVKQPWSWLPMVYPSASDNFTDRSGNGRNWTLPSGALTVEDGAPVTWGAPIIVPQYATVVAPVLSLPGVQDITATGATPKVTLTY